MDVAELLRRAYAFVLAFEGERPPPEPFEELLVDIARFQEGHSAPYARLCQARGNPVTHGHIPAVPAEAFRAMRIATFPETATQRVFLTSGTTSETSGRHVFRDLGLYEAGSVAFARSLLGLGSTRHRVMILGPTPKEVPHSSLTFMFALFQRAFGAPSNEDFFVRDGVLDITTFVREVERLRGDEPVLLLATSFSLVHLLDALRGPLELPPRSLVLHTGGFKGRTREVEPIALREAVSRALTVDALRIRLEYGMTELSSQFYDVPGAPLYVEPPWARVVAVDPHSGERVRDGEVGVARIEDLLNVESACAILTKDRVRRVPGGFQLLGRLPEADARGCSLNAEGLLTRTVVSEG